jgi:7-cyano-7-deazaguanine synthase
VIDSSSKLVVLSGGIDSVVLLHKVLQESKKNRDVSCLSFDYGQKHKKELTYAKYWTSLFNLTHHLIDIKGLLSNSALIKSDVFLGMGGIEMPKNDDDMRPTIVPGRNLLMISIAASIAMTNGHRYIYLGTNKDDHEVYPDCRPAFLNSAANAVMSMSEGKVLLEIPFEFVSKKDVVKLGKAFNIDFDRTWSCYEGGDEPCGVCGACQVRKKAMQ